MTAVEVRTLADLEAVIERGVQTFVEVGEALREISERRLYREQGFSTFEEYCRKRWGWQRRHGYELMQAAEVVSNVRSNAQSLPSLTQAVQLAPLTPTEQREVAAKTDFSTKTVAELREEIKALKNSGNQKERVRAEKMEASLDFCDKLSEAADVLAVHYSSESAEWYTPPEIIARVVLVLGGIDLDPCSNSSGEPNVSASQRFTVSDDGLSHPWEGRVYMNPPYGRVIDAWAEKLVSEYHAGRTTQAIALVPARVDTDWFRRFRDFAICFIDGRLKFSGHVNSAPFPSAVVYLGGDIDRFHDAFSDLGDIWVRWQK